MNESAQDGDQAIEFGTWIPNRGYFYSNLSANMFSPIRLVLAAAQIGVVVRVLSRLARGRPIDRLWRRLAILGGVTWLLGRVETVIDSRYADRARANQVMIDARATNRGKRGATPAAGDDEFWLYGDSWRAGIFRRVLELGDEAPIHLEQRAKAFRVVYLRPFALENRALVNFGPTFASDPPFISKWPTLETTLARVVNGLGFDIVSYGHSTDPHGVAHRDGGSEWLEKVQQELLECDAIIVVPMLAAGTRLEWEFILDQQLLGKTIALMPPAVIPNALVFSRFPTLARVAVRVLVGRPTDVDLRTWQGLPAMGFRDPQMRPDWEESARLAAQMGTHLPEFEDLGMVFTLDPTSKEPKRLGALARVVDVFSLAESDLTEDDKEQLRHLLPVAMRHGGHLESLLTNMAFGNRSPAHLLPLYRRLCELEQARLQPRPPRASA